MVAVPAAVSQVAASGGVTVSIESATTYVSPGSNFTIDAVVNNPLSNEVAMFNLRLAFDPNYFTVNSVTKGDFPEDMGAAVINNTAGTIQYDPKTAVGTSINGTHLVGAHINCTAKSLEGSSTVDYRYTSGPPPAYTKVVYGATDYLEGGNMSLMLSGTVIVGSPKLTVDVSPAGKGAVKADGVLLTGYPNTTNRSWFAVVSLQAVNPAPGWAFDKWTGDVTGSANPTNVTMNALTKNVTANFVELPPGLGVSPLSLDFSARYGDNTDNKTVTISNTGGGTLCWSLGTPPVWTIGDNWTYNDVYQPFAPPWAPLVPGANASILTQTVTGYGSNYQCDITITPPEQRSMMGGMPCVLWNATVLVDEYTLDYVQQLGYMSIYPYAGGGNFTPVDVIANLTWAYAGCHGWPYYAGKTWSYTLTEDVKTVIGGAPVDYKVIPCMAMVTNVSQTVGPFTDCYEITHFALPNMTAFMQTWWSPTAKNLVLTADGGTFDFPPMDVRLLASMSVADPPSVPPAWISFDKTQGSLGIGGSDVVTVTASSSGLAVGTYTGSFDISAAGSIQEKTVNVSLEVLPATTIDVIRNLPADALDLDAEYPGDTFDVWVNFTAPIDDFNAIGLTDLAPAGWAVQTNTAWCSPVASWTKGEGNKAEYSWAGPYVKDQVFSAKYKVTIPATANNGLNDWPNNDGSKAWAEYWFGAQGPYTSNVTGEWQKIVTVPGKVVGETRDVNADLLTTTLVVLSENPPEALDEPEDSDSSTAPAALYKLDVDDTGQYWMEASKYCYFALDTDAMPITRNPAYPDYIDFGTTAKLAAGWTQDFEGDYGLVPKACTMSYAMKSVNHWLFPPTGHPEWQLSDWKAMESVHSWQFPTGCNL
jgi:hypothetical protein